MLNYKKIKLNTYWIYFLILDTQMAPNANTNTASQLNENSVNEQSGSQNIDYEVLKADLKSLIQIYGIERVKSNLESLEPKND